MFNFKISSFLSKQKRVLHESNQTKNNDNFGNFKIKQNNQPSISQKQPKIETIQQTITHSQPAIAPMQQSISPNQNRIKKTRAFIISNIEGGGSLKYMNDITKHYNKDVDFIFIRNKGDLLKVSHFIPSDILFVQQLLYTDILPDFLLRIKRIFCVKIIISIHDFCWFIDNDDINNPKKITNINEVGYSLNLLRINSSIVTLFEIASLVIHPSNFTKEHYSRFFPINNCILQEHNDIFVDYHVKNIPKITNNVIKICNFQGYSKYKGSEMVDVLFKKYSSYKEYNIEFLIVGKNVPEYTEQNWHIVFRELNPHCLLHLNKYGETYSYALSKSINSGLPILYNDIGSFKERIPKKNEHYKSVISNENEYYNSDKLFVQFENMLDYIIENNGKWETSNLNNEIIYKEAYNNIFCNRCKVVNYDKIKPFAVYFPQFHSIIENNENYYNGMTDIKNLYYSINTNNYDLDTPSLNEFNLKSIIDYDLTNKNIIKRQIEIARNNCIFGFAVYYYWFSVNDITHKNTIMENCYNLFFEEEISDFKFFFYMGE